MAWHDFFSSQNLNNTTSCKVFTYYKTWENSFVYNYIQKLCEKKQKKTKKNKKKQNKTKTKIEKIRVLRCRWNVLCSCIRFDFLTVYIQSYSVTRDKQSYSVDMGTKSRWPYFKIQSNLIVLGMPLFQNTVQRRCVELG